MSIRGIRGRLARLERAAVRHVELLPDRPAPPADDSGDLAAELAADFGRLVEGYRRHVAPTPEEAVRLAADAAAAASERALTCPPDQLTWFDLYSVEQSNPQKALDRWEEVKAQALAELRDGFRAARALDTPDGGCWERAQFLALRAELQEEWRPQTGLERQLIDQMAQHRTLMLRWQGTLAAYTGLAAFAARRQARGTDPYEPPRLSDAEAIERAAGMVERFSRLYLRTLRACWTRGAWPGPSSCAGPVRSTSPGNRSTWPGRRPSRPRRRFPWWAAETLALFKPDGALLARRTSSSRGTTLRRQPRRS